MSFRRRLLPFVFALAPLPLLAAEPLTISGQLLDPRGAAVAGARVELLPAPDRSHLGRWVLGLEPEPPPTVQGTTDADGRFQLTATNPGHWRLRFVDKEGRRIEETLPVIADVELGALQQPREFPHPVPKLDTAAPAAERAVAVLDAAGQPVPEAVFWLAGQPVWATDAQGRGLVPRGVEPASQEGFEIVAAGRFSARWDGTGPLPRLVPPVRLTGRVRSAAGTPVAGALVWPTGHTGEFTTTGAEGQFELLATAGVSEVYELKVAAPGYVPLRTEVRAGVPPNTLRLTPAATVTGQVVDAQGRPQEGFLVTAESDEEPTPLLPPPRFRTGADGRFRLADLTPGRAFTLRAVRPELARGQLATAALASGETRANLRIPVVAFRVAVGRVVDGEGEPLAGAVATLSPAGSQTRYFDTTSPDPASSGRHRRETTADGRFRIPGLEPGRYDLRVRAAGFAPVTVRGLQVPERGSTVDLGTVHLAAAATLRGRVVDPAGDPLADVEIGFFASQGRLLEIVSEDDENRVFSNPDGEFTIADLPPGGTVTLTLQHPGFVRQDVPGVRVPRAEELVVELVPASRVTGRVIERGGGGIEGAQVASPESRWEGATTDATGAFTLEGLAPGTIQLLATAAGFLEPPAKTIEIVAGEVIPEVVFELDRGAVVTGRVTGPDGGPLEDAFVYLRDTTGFGNEFTRTDAEGSYRLSGVPPGERRLAAGSQGLIDAIRTITVRPGDNRLDFRLERGLHVRGRVLGPEGQAVDQGEVAATEEPGGSLQERGPIRPDGSFEITNLKPGRYRLRADSLDYAPGESPEPIQVGPQSVEGVVVTLRRGARLVGTVKGLSFDELNELQIVATSLDGTQYAPGQLDFRGGFEVKNVTPGAWTVIASVGNRQTMAQVDVEAGAAETRVELEFGGGYTLTGRVLRGGRPVPNAGILVSTSQELAGGFATTDHAGQFSVPDLAPGEYQVAVATNWNGFAHSETVALDGDRDITLEIVGSTVAGRVIDSDGEALPNVRVNLRGEDAGAFGGWGSEQRSDEAGLFRFPDVAPGRYRLSGQKDGYAQGEAAVEVTVGDAEAELRLAPAPGLVLEVRTLRGLLPNGASVAVAAVDGQGRVAYRGSGEADERGRVRLASLPLGSWTLWLSCHGYAQTRLTVSHPGPAVPVVLGPGAELQIEVPALRASTEAAHVTLVGADGPLPTLHQGLELAYQRPLFLGQTTVGEIPPGRWTVQVVSASGGTWEKSVEVAAGVTRVVVE
ncbi:MAG: carboxypeptidase regulatory-like domain-containing protein [Thermoanaerobaculia bacterium]|nr:carboxypeptidase regulatory-like domain-containing protein [Thermoanaerobaculia bacterium]